MTEVLKLPGPCFRNRLESYKNYFCFNLKDCTQSQHGTVTPCSDPDMISQVSIKTIFKEMCINKNFTMVYSISLAWRAFFDSANVQLIIRKYCSCL